MKRKTEKGVSWTVLKSGRYTCLRCGGDHPLTLPIEVGEFAKETKAFNYLHRNCKAAEAQP